jgi:hypothetical protein
MKEECCNHNCNQGRDCPLRKKTLSDAEIQEVIDSPQFEEIFDLEDFAKAILKKASEK